MIKVSGYSDDIIEIERIVEGKTVWEEEYDSYDRDTLFLFDDGTKLRMTYNGSWQAVVEERGTAGHSIEKLESNGAITATCLRFTRTSFRHIGRSDRPCHT